MDEMMQFSELYSTLYPLAVETANGILNDAHLSQDVAQEVLVAMWHANKRFTSHIRQPSAWVRAVATYMALRARTRRSGEITVSEFPETPSRPWIGLVDLLLSVPEDHRSLFDMISRGWTVSDLADHYRCPVGPMKWRIWKVKQELRTKMDR